MPHLHVVSRSLEDYEKFVRQKLTRIRGIGALESHFVFGKVKKHPVYPTLEA